MKKLLILALVIFSLVSCSKSKDEPIPQTITLTGKWKIIEAKVSAGAGLPTNWTSINGGYELSFSDAGTYSTTEYATCNSGSFSVVNQVINYTNTCGNTTPILKYRILSMTATELILQDLFCTEECRYKYLKISSVPN